MGCAPSKAKVSTNTIKSKDATLKCEQDEEKEGSAKIKENEGIEDQRKVMSTETTLEESPERCANNHIVVIPELKNPTHSCLQKTEVKCEVEELTIVKNDNEMTHGSVVIPVTATDREILSDSPIRYGKDGTRTMLSNSPTNDKCITEVKNDDTAPPLFANSITDLKCSEENSVIETGCSDSRTKNLDTNNESVCELDNNISSSESNSTEPTISAEVETLNNQEIKPTSNDSISGLTVLDNIKGSINELTYLESDELPVTPSKDNDKAVV